MEFEKIQKIMRCFNGSFINSNNELIINNRDGINAYLGTNFTVEDMGIIYCKLGNAINSELCVKFIESGYDMKLLEKEEV